VTPQLHRCPTTTYPPWMVADRRTFAVTTKSHSTGKHSKLTSHEEPQLCYDYHTFDCNNIYHVLLDVVTTRTTTIIFSENLLELQILLPIERRGRPPNVTPIKHQRVDEVYEAMTEHCDVVTLVIWRG